jgi:multidrug efflux pump subunit AcrB
LIDIDPLVIETLNGIDGLANASSNLSTIAASGGGGDDGPVTYIRINQQSALSYTAELETENTIGVTQQAIAAVEALDLPAGIAVSEGFESQVQTDGFNSLFSAMAIAIAIVILILMITFNSLIHWFTLILSIIVAPVGAAIALTLTDEVLGISALIGLLMLIGLVVTNAIVLIDRVQSNRRERGMNIHDALIEAGGRRLRPILMTTLATIIALIPLSVGLSDGAIIAAQLGIVVIGGVTSSMLLTLLVVPVAYRIFDPLHQWIAQRVHLPGNGLRTTAEQGSSAD